MSGETEQQVSGWTVDTLHQKMQYRFIALQNHLDERHATLKELLDERHENQKTAMAAALAAAEKAVAKAEAAADKRFDSVNEFRKTLSDQTASFITREAFDAKMETFEAKLAALTTGEDRRKGKETGINAVWLLAGQVILMVGTIIAIIVALNN